MISAGFALLLQCSSNYSTSAWVTVCLTTFAGLPYHTTSGEDALEPLRRLYSELKRKATA